MNPADTTDWRQLSRVQQVLIFTICRLQQLKWIGIVEGGHVKPAPKAEAAFTEMLKEGFTPTSEETQQAVKGIQEHFARLQAEDAARTIDWTEVVAWHAERESQEQSAP